MRVRKTKKKEQTWIQCDLLRQVNQGFPGAHAHPEVQGVLERRFHRHDHRFPSNKNMTQIYFENRHCHVTECLKPDFIDTTSVYVYSKKRLL